MTVRDWEALFQRSGLTILCITPLGVPAIILEALKRNITMLSRADWPPFSVYFVAQKPK
jgi:hypothetical protein